MTKFHVASQISRGALLAVVHDHPRMRSFRERMSGRLNGGEPHANALAEHVLRRVVGDVADIHLTKVMERLGKIEKIRERIDVAIDSVLDGKGLPKDTNVYQMEAHFSELRTEMLELSGPRDDLMGKGDFHLPEPVDTYSNTTIEGFQHGFGTPEAGVFREPIAEMQKRFKSLPADQRALLKRAAEVSPKDLNQAIAGTETTQAAALKRLREKVPEMSDAEFKQVADGVQQIGKSRSKGLLLDSIELSGALKDIHDPELRKAISSDPWVVGATAIMSPQQLTDLWNAHVAAGGDAKGFRQYVRHQVDHYARAVFGEHAAAFGTSGIDRFLKGPDFGTYAPGTDLVAIGNDQWTWVLEDKSHRIPRGKSSMSPLANASAIFDNLVGNLADDARRFREQELRMRTDVPTYRTPDNVADAIQHMAACSDDLRRHLESLPEAERFSPASIAKMRGILDSHRIKLRITSGFGVVSQISTDLAALGIRVQSTGPQITIPR